MPFATVSEISKARPRPPAAGAEVLEILLPARYLSDHFTAAVATSNLITISEADLHDKSKFVHHPRQQFSQFSADAGTIKLVSKTRSGSAGSCSDDDESLQNDLDESAYNFR
ncbi:unnamed protein product [Sphagnum jensenii]|uniref:Uncharacterized protein n=1 Tax=Sphagnum jensenii TaxID=128206 RepID=A0ABP1AI41_9BRYO